MYVAVSGGNHFVGGTGRGCQFLRDCGTYVPYSFLGYLSGGQDSVAAPSTSRTQAGSDKDSLRVSVEKLFNKLYSEYVHKPNAKLPYSKLKARGISIDGLPGRC
jgi:hypothetical protein